jgi:hypothetical protein
MIQSQKIIKQLNYMGARQTEVINLLAKMINEEFEDTKGVIRIRIGTTPSL